MFLWRVLVAVVSLSCTANSLLLHPLAKLQVWDNTTDTVQAHISSCECRSICMASTSCTGVSVTRLSSNKVSCAFASAPLHLGVMEESSKQVTTYVKGVACQPPFTYHVDAGCYLLSTDEVSYGDAKQACPAGSSLALPPSDERFRVMMAYLATLDATSSGFWIGLGRDTTSSTYLWSDGRSVSEALWGQGNPNDSGTKCAVAYKSFDFLLNDVGCTATYDYVCLKN